MFCTSGFQGKMLRAIRPCFIDLLRARGLIEVDKSPAARLAGYHTCQTIGKFGSPHVHLSKYKALIAWTISTRSRRKLYPDPQEQDPEYFLLPKEQNTQLDLTFVPELSNNGPKLVNKIQEVVKSGQMGRLFAVVHIDGKQRKVTTEDLLVVNGFFPPQTGDKIRLEKVMALGSKDFTLLGRPLLERDLVKIEATVIEKTVSHVKIHYTQKKRFRRLKLTQNPISVLVINSIQMNPAALT